MALREPKSVTDIQKRAARLRVLQLLAQNETAVARVYERFALKIPRKQIFWNELAAEEHGHARLIEMIGKKIDAHEVIFSDRALDVAAILDSIGFLNTKLSYLDGASITHIEALCLAERIEKMIVERCLFLFFAAASAETERDFENIRADTFEHIQRIRQQIKGEWWQKQFRRRQIARVAAEPLLKVPSGLIGRGTRR